LLWDGILSSQHGWSTMSYRCISRQISANRFVILRIGTIQRNSIGYNKKNGIHVIGINNSCNIFDNEHIDYNKMAGIKIADEAKASIARNNIVRNLGQGILIVESSSAHIEKNVISENLKANIAFGGAGSANVTIFENTISKSKAEGIYMIEAGNAWIFKNKIVLNNEGIMCITSLPDIKENQIEGNKSNGITMINDSRAKLEKKYFKL